MYKWGIFQRVVAFLGENNLAMPAIMFTDVWQWTPFCFLLCLSVFQLLPKEPYEAADVEGANSWQKFRYITLPAINPTIFMVTILSTIGGFSLFIEPYIMTSGGPLNSTLSAMLYIYKQAFDFYHMGYSATLGVFFAFVIMMVVVIQKYTIEKDN